MSAQKFLPDIDSRHHWNYFDYLFGDDRWLFL